MRKNNEQTLKEVLLQVVGNPRIRDKYLAAQIENIWKEEMGKTISDLTSKISFKDGILTLSITSAPLRQELHTARNKIILLMNQALESDLIKEVRVF